MYIPQDNIHNPLYVVAVVFNPVRFKQRWKLYRDFQRHVRESGAILVTIEAAMGERDFALKDHAYPHETNQHSGEPKMYGPANVPPSARMPPNRMNQDYIQVRVQHQQELWLKENLQNLAAQHLPPEAKYIAFIDADVKFTRPDWHSETLHALQHYHVVQMFSTVVELSPSYQPHQLHRGFVFSHCNHRPGHGGQNGGGSNNQDPYGFNIMGPISKGPVTSTEWHPGYAWAWRREALDHVGGLIDHGILGAGDRHMACSLVGRAQHSFPKGLHQKYIERILHWQRRAMEHIKGNVGYIDGTLLHYWHGRKVNRKYLDRWQILVRHGFNPETDLKRDMNGVFKLTDTKPALRDDIRRYFRARHEDSIDMPEEDDKILGPAPGFPR